MKGLLLKDWYILRNKGKMFLLIIPLYLAIALFQGNGFFLYFCAVFAAMVPRTFASYDEHARWSCYTAALPMSKGQVVLARYIAAVLSLLYTLAILGVLHLVGSILLRQPTSLTPLLSQSSVMTDLPTSVSLMAVLFSLYTAFSMPCIYRFGMEKGRIMQMVLMLAFMMAAGAVSMLTAENEIPFLSHMEPSLLLPGMLLVSIGVLIASYFLSVKWYRYTPNP